MRRFATYALARSGRQWWPTSLAAHAVGWRRHYTQTMTIATVEGLLASVLGFEQLYVSRAVRNTANLEQTISLSAIIDDDALVYYNNPNAGVFDATALKTFAWAPGGAVGQIRTYRDDAADSDIVKHKEQWDQKLVASDLGYFFSDIV